MKRVLPVLKLLLILSFWSQCAQAQETPLANSGPEREKLVITADEALEWHRDKNFFMALGKAKAVQGGTSIEAGSLKAQYRNSGSNELDLQEIIARENVVVRTPEAATYGDLAEYDIAGGVAVMTGANLKMVSEDYTVTAKDSFIYDVTQGRLEARGDAVATSEENILRADRLIAIFEEREGERSLKTIEAENNIIITTPTETVYGDEGIYRAETNTVDLFGNVKIERGPNMLEGARAQVNLTTNVSRILGAREADDPDKARVRGTFYPDSFKEKQ